MSIYSGIATETLTARLTEAQDAYHALATGAQIVQVRTSDTAVSFSSSDPASMLRLSTYIRDLQRALGIASSRVTGVYLTGGKGV